ncbi:ArsC/Spx/MgsR family protein [Lactococcus formosensis]|uniref:ArsC/Spx/MgsR family protein n=2 Tax=Lactococcus formosensis TaxID=1281486 RepID=UPI0022E196CA|nr:ArsC/Spx/MgsR family protein [Lactococcus formosensis]
MITLFYDKTDLTNKKAASWFTSRGIEVHLKNIRYISKQELLHILKLSDQGFMDIVKKGTISGESDNTIYNMTFDEYINYIIGNPELLKSPIIIDDSKLLIGFNSDNIRQFLPSFYRKLGKNNSLKNY